MKQIEFGPFVANAQNIRNVLKESPNLVAEFDRAAPARTATPDRAGAYLMVNPEPWAPEERDANEFAHLITHAGPDTWRMRVVDPALFGNSIKVLPIGGSCAIETWGMRTIERERHEQNRVSRVAERILSMAPTFTHASGAFLTGGPRGVHLIENRLWAARLNEWGVSGANEKVLEAYARIHAVVVRRAQLINPEAEIVSMSFDELGLREGPIARWCKEMRLPDDPNFGASEVLYTYCGPELRDIVTRNLLRSGNAWAQDVTHVVRLKQVDHNDWDSSFSADAKADLLCGIAPSPDANHSTLAASAIARWVRMNARKNTSRVSGFFDMPFNKGPLHMVQKLPSADSSIEGQMDSPARLWHDNVDAHLTYLETVLTTTEVRVDEAVIRASAEAKKLRGETERTFRQAAATILKQETRLTEFRQQEHLFVTLLRGERPTTELQTTTEALIKRTARHMDSFANRVCSELDREDQIQLIALREDLIGDTIRPKLWTKLIQQFLNECADAMHRIEQQLSEARKSLDSVQEKLSAMDASSVRFTPIVRQVTMGLYPLHNNLFICYATQFLFDPDFRAFLAAVASVDASDVPKQDKQCEVRRLCGVIYPKLASYLRYIMVGGIYPSEMRASHVF